MLTRAWTTVVSAQFRRTSRFILLLSLLANLLIFPSGAHAAALTFTSGSPANGTYGTLYAHTFTTNNLATFSVSSGTLPLGLALAPTGTLTGIPLQSGQFALVVKAQSLLESATQSFMLTINKRALTVTADNQTITYGGTIPDLTYTATGLLSGDTLGSILTGAPATSATSSSPAGSYAITQGTLSALNYLITFVPGTLTIAKALLTATADDLTRTVNTANPTLTIHYSGFVNGDTLAGLNTPPNVSTTATTNSPVGSYPISLSGGTDTNYLFNLVNGVLTVTSLSVPEIVWNNPAAMTYGQVLGASQLNATAMFGGQAVSGNLTYDPPAGTVLSAGNGQALRVTFTPLNTALFSVVTGQVTVDVARAPLTVTADAQTMTYGDSVPNLTVNASGLVNGDTLGVAVTGAPATSASVTSPAGNYDITQGTLSALNYLVNFVAGTLTVAKAPLTVTADNLTRTVNTANPTLTVHYSGFVNGDTLANVGTQPNVSTTATLNSPVGSYPISLSGGTDTNYLFNLVNGVLTVTSLSVSQIVWNDPAPLTYGQTIGAGQLNAAASFGGQAVSGTFSYDPPAGTALNVGSGHILHVTFTPLNTALYAIVTEQVQISVTRAPLTITANNQSMTYGGSIPDLTFSASGLVNGDTLGAAVTGVLDTNAIPGSPAGSYPITQGTLGALNYLINFVAGTLTVAKAPLTVTAEDLTRTVNTANPALSVHYSGFVNGDTTAALGTPPSASTTATLNSPVGDYPITLSGGTDTNYLFNLVNGVLTVTNLNVPQIVWSSPAPLTYGQALGAGQLNATATFGGQAVSGTFSYDPPAGAVLSAGSGQALQATFTPLDGTLFSAVTRQVQINVTRAPLTITAANQTMTYGGTLPSLTFSTAGLVNGDTIGSALTGALATNATVTSPAGSYTISQGTLSALDYLIDFVDSTLAITKAPLTATADNLTRLTNTANPPLTIHYSGFVNGDTAAELDTPPSANTTATINSPVGNYPITLSGGTDGNYTLTLIDGTMKITNKNVPQIVWNNPASIIYGKALSATQLNAKATFGGQPVSGSFAYDPPAGRVLNVGNGQVLHTTFTPQNSSSYETVSGQAQINVTRAPLTITANNQTMIQGHTVPTLTARYSGFVNGDTSSSLDHAAVLRTNATPQSKPGTYLIVPSGASDSNYAITFVNGSLKDLWGMYLAVTRR